MFLSTKTAYINLDSFQSDCTMVFIEPELTLCVLYSSLNQIAVHIFP